jgi:hypothetical protein
MSMNRQTSHNALSRDSNRNGLGCLRLLALLCGSIFLAIVFVLVAHFPDSPLGRTIDARLTELADPESWTP